LLNKLSLQIKQKSKTMDIEKSIDVLNTLIEINNDRIEGYETTSKETEEVELKSLFARFSQTSYNSKSELIKEVQRLGGEATEGTTTTGKFFRVWMDVKVALASNDHKAILDSCEYGEEVAVKTYEKALRDNLDDLTFDQQSMINTQHNLIKTDYEKIRVLKDADFLIENN
jgi:uncharacterized protein (TIGR02284 family)